MDTSKYYTNQEAAEYLGVSMARIYQINVTDEYRQRYGWITRKLGATVLIPKIAVHAYKEAPPSVGWKAGRARKAIHE